MKIQTDHQIIQQAMAEAKKYDCLLPWDGKASLPGPWEFWNHQITAVGMVISQQWENLTQLAIKLPHNDALKYSHGPCKLAFPSQGNNGSSFDSKLFNFLISS